MAVNGNASTVIHPHSAIDHPSRSSSLSLESGVEVKQLIDCRLIPTEYTAPSDESMMG